MMSERTNYKIAKCECTNCCQTAKYSFQKNPYCRDCLIDMMECWQDENKGMIVENDLDFMVLKVILCEKGILIDYVAERLNKNYGLDIKELEED